MAAMVRLMALTCRKVFQGVAWAYAFDGNGYTCQPTHVRDGINAALEWSAVTELTAKLPSLEEFELIFPSNRDLPLRELLSVHLRPSSSQPTPRRRPPVAEVAVVEPGRHLRHGRLRSSSSLSLAPAPESRESVPATSTLAPAATSSSAQPSVHSHSAPPPGLRMRLFPVGRPLYARRPLPRPP